MSKDKRWTFLNSFATAYSPAYQTPTGSKFRCPNPAPIPPSFLPYTDYLPQSSTTIPNTRIGDNIINEDIVISPPFHVDCVLTKKKICYCKYSPYTNPDSQQLSEYMSLAKEIDMYSRGYTDQMLKAKSIKVCSIFPLLYSIKWNKRDLRASKSVLSLLI